MRIGQNPAKSVQGVPQPADVTVAVVVYVPFIGGYYEHSLDVLKVCLESIIANTKEPFDLMVFDNASCLEVQDYLLELQASGGIQYLTLADKNVGKVGAWNYLVGAAPGKYIAYADGDVFHYPGWLGPQIEVLKKLPNAGMVTGMPLLALEEKSSTTIAWAENTPGVKCERGHFLSWEDYWRHGGTLGRPEAEVREYYNQNPIVRIEFDGKQYYAGASHFQFTARKEILQQFFPLQADRPMGQVRQLDDAINEKGYLRLSTLNYLIQHIGNELPDDRSDEGIRAFLETSPVQKTFTRKTFWDWKIFRKLLHWVYSKSFDILYRR